MSIYSFTFSINHHKDFLLTETVGILTNMDNTSIKPIAPYRIGLLMVDGFAIMSYASATEPLRAANLLAETPLYSVKHIPVSGARATSSNKTEIKANAQMILMEAFNKKILIHNHFLHSNSFIRMHFNNINSACRLKIKYSVCFIRESFQVGNKF